MQKAKSLGFKITKWQHNKSASLNNLRTQADLFSYSIKDSEDKSGAVVGFAFRWLLTFYAGNIEAVHFACEEMYHVEEQNLSVKEVEQIVRRSYYMAYGEAMTKLRSIGLNTSFPAFEKMNINIQEIHQILYK